MVDLHQPAAQEIICIMAQSREAVAPRASYPEAPAKRRWEMVVAEAATVLWILKALLLNSKTTVEIPIIVNCPVVMERVATVERLQQLILTRAFHLSTCVLLYRLYVYPLNTTKN